MPPVGGDIHSEMSPHASHAKGDRPRQARPQAHPHVRRSGPVLRAFPLGRQALAPQVPLPLQGKAPSPGKVPRVTAPSLNRSFGRRVGAATLADLLSPTPRPHLGQNSHWAWLAAATALLLPAVARGANLPSVSFPRSRTGALDLLPSVDLAQSGRPPSCLRQPLSTIGCRGCHSMKRSPHRRCTFL